MEDSKLKDVILSSINEVQSSEMYEKRENGKGNLNLSFSEITPEEIQSIQTDHKVEKDLFFKQNGYIPPKTTSTRNKEEIEFLGKVRERIIVLFEGLKSEDIVHLENKLNLTVNFLETLIVLIDNRIKGE
jgi:hypothetical protein